MGTPTWNEVWRLAQAAPIFMSEEEARRLWALAHEAKGGCVECGSLYGGSAIVLASAGPVVCVDPLDQSPDGPRDLFPAFWRNVSRSPWAHNVSVITRRDVDVFPTWPRLVGLLFVDHDHSEEGTRASLDGWRPHLLQGAAVALHDYGHPDYPGVRAAVDASGIRLVEVVQKLAVCRWEVE